MIRTRKGATILKTRCLVLDHDDTVVCSGRMVNYPALLEGLKKNHPEIELTYEDFCRLCFRHNYTGMCRLHLNMTEREINEQFDFWKDYVRTHIPPAYEGIGPLLRRFRREGGLICVSSHSGTENILRDYRRNFGFEPDGIYAWELGEALRKPHPHTLQVIMERFQLKPEELLMVDDMKSGYDMAAACKVPFVCAGWSHELPELRQAMKAYSPHYFEQVSDFEAFLFGDLTNVI